LNLFLVREVSEIRGDISQGLGVVGTIAKEEAEVRILDNNSLNITHSSDQIIEKIRKFNPDVVGFHVHTHNIYKTGILVNKLKETLPNICLIAGGLHAFYEPEEIMDLGVHIVAVEEADLTIIPLLKAIKGSETAGNRFQIDGALSDKLEKIPGLIFFNAEESKRKNTGKPNYIQNMDDLPFVDYSLFNLDDYIKKPTDAHYVTNTLLTLRGCPFTCTFCQGETKSAYNIPRQNSPEYRLKYIQYLMEHHGHEYFIFYDSNFTINRKKTLEFCKQMVDSGLNKKVKFWCETNVALKLDRELASALKEAGCSDVALGIERLNPQSMKKIGKSVSRTVIDETIHNLHEVGIRVSANALLGFPFDTQQSIKEEEALFTEILEHVDVVMVSVVLPLPGTAIYNQTDNKKWYMDQKYIEWRPPFYQLAYHYTDGNAWYANYFGLSEDTMGAIRGMRERMHIRSIEKVNNPIVSFLFILVQLFGKLSLAIFKRSHLAERIILAPVRITYAFLWKFMVSKFYLNR
jgi:anaerobic magnesium-protoporphyrin IX monomethyl ester cyclase